MHKCNKCNANFEQENDLINHNASRHSLKRSFNEKEMISNKKKSLICDVCNKSYSDQGKFKKHQFYCLKCKQCKKKFANNKEFQKHRKQHFLLKKKHRK